jgi:rhodanese-related sulfurtransferase
MADAHRMSAQELKRRMDANQNITVIDTRNPQAWEQSDTKIPGAIRVPIDQLESNLGRIPKEGTVVAYCT